MEQRVLITGGAGYLGSVLAEHLLAAGCHVTILDNLTYGQSSLFHLCDHPRFQFTLGDARDQSTLSPLIQSADVLLPLAALVGAPACDRNPHLARELNTDALLLLNRLRSPRQLLIFPATQSGHGHRSDDSLCTEDTPLEPISLYARTKVAAEAALLASPNTLSLRLATVFGVSPRMRIDLLVNHFVHAAVTAGTLTLYQKDFKRSMVHIRDVADAFLFSIQNAPAMLNRPFNLGLDSANISKAELALRIKQHVPTFDIRFSDIGADFDQRNYRVSSQRLRALGFEARHSLDQGIRELLTLYRMSTAAHAGPPGAADPHRNC